MPPCAFAELHDCTASLATSPTRAPARSADTAAARPEAPLPTTSTSNASGAATRRLYHRTANYRHKGDLSRDLTLDMRRLALEGVRDRIVQRQLTPLPPRRREARLIERAAHGVDRLVVRRLLRRGEGDTEALAQRLRGPEQPRCLLGALREREHRGESFEAVADHVPELE